MGFIDTMQSENLPVFFNVVHAVGENCPNHKDDVKLVQYLLMSFYDKLHPSLRPNGNIGVTGFCGGATLNWIKKFQLDINKTSPGAVLADGRVDRVRNHSTKGSISKTTYTLGSLNLGVLTVNPDAFFATPGLIPLANPMNVPPPSPDVVSPPVQVPSSGGI